MAQMTTYANDILQAGLEALPWEKLRGKNILVTGATGLIGGCLVEILMRRTHTYHIYAAGRDRQRACQRFADFTSDPTFHFLPYDVRQPLTCSIPFHFIIHAASYASPAYFASRPVEVITANIYGVNNLMEYGIRNGMERMLYVSTGEIYGQSEAETFKETDSGYVDCATQRACYPSSKRAAESLCIAYSAEFGADVVIARPCHTYGPHFTAGDNRVFCQFIRNVIDGEDIVMKSDGSQMRSWCYVTDCARGLLYILLKGQRGEAYNIADPSSVFSIRQLAEAIAESAGRKVVCRLPPDQERSGYSIIKHAVFDTTKLQALGWNTEGDWRRKMRSSVEECRNDLKI